MVRPGEDDKQHCVMSSRSQSLSPSQDAQEEGRTERNVVYDMLFEIGRRKRTKTIMVNVQWGKESKEYISILL